MCVSFDDGCNSGNFNRFVMCEQHHTDDTRRRVYITLNMVLVRLALAITVKR